MMDDPSVRVRVNDDSVKVKVNDPTMRAYEEPIEEFTTEDFDRGARRVAGGAANVVGQVGRLYFNLLTLPLNLLPSRSRYHAKNSIREGFLSFKVLIDDVTGAVDDGLRRSLERDKVRASMNDWDDDDIIRPAGASGKIRPARGDDMVDTMGGAI